MWTDAEDYVRWLKTSRTVVNIWHCCLEGVMAKIAWYCNTLWVNLMPLLPPVTQNKFVSIGLSTTHLAMYWLCVTAVTVNIMSGEKCNSDVTHLCHCRWWDPSIAMFRILAACDSEFANTAFMTVWYNDTLAWLLVWRNVCCIVVTILFIISACFTNHQMDS
jgi:hypothetical protein